MKRSQFYIIIVFALFCTSCKKDFLEVPDKTVLLRQGYVTDLKTAGDYLNGIYVEFAGNFYTGYVHVYPELIADNAKAYLTTYMSNYYNWLQQADLERATSFSRQGQNANGLWFSGYRVIRDCNFIIEEVDKYRSENIDKANDIKGQAYAFRAFTHFFLVNVFAQSFNYTADGSHPGIPYVTTSDYSQSVSRQMVSEVYENLISDLNNAIQLLPVTVTNTCYMNQAAAKALLARVYLFKEDYQSAKNVASEVAKKYPLLQIANGYPDNIYKLLPISQTESLFQMPPSYPGVANSAGDYSTFFAGYLYSVTSRFRGTVDIATILKENPQDIRSKWVTKSGAEWNVTKYISNVIPNFPVASLAYYETLFRSSESFLTAAEAYAKLNNDSALYYLNAIRLRANPSIAPVTATGAALLDSIYKERRKELSFEGLRMFDLLRWKKGVYRTDPVNTNAQSLPYPSNKALAPLPSADVDLSGLTQNFGY